MSIDVMWWWNSMNSNKSSSGGGGREDENKNKRDKKMRELLMSFWLISIHVTKISSLHSIDLVHRQQHHINNVPHPHLFYFIHFTQKWTHVLSKIEFFLYICSVWWWLQAIKWCGQSRERREWESIMISAFFGVQSEWHVGILKNIQYKVIIILISFSSLRLLLLPSLTQSLINYSTPRWWYSFNFN